MQVNSIEELVEAGINDLQALANRGNTVAQYWLERIQQQPIAAMKLSVFGDMRIALLGDISIEAELVYKTLFPEEK